MPEAPAAVDPRRNTWGNKPSLAETHKALADEWDAGRNGELTPWDVSSGSNKRIWWVCAEYGHPWKAQISHRIRGSRCGVCANRVFLPGFNDLATTDEKLAVQFLPQNNGGVASDQVLGGSSRKKWVWTCVLGHNWSAAVSSRSAGRDCPFCGNKALLPGFNDLKTTDKDLADQFFSQNNGGVTPNRVLGWSSNKKWVWTCERGHNWSAAVYHRTAGQGCPQCSKSETSRVEQALFRVMSTRLTDPVSGERIQLEWSSKQTTAAIDVSGTYGGLAVSIEYDGEYWHHGAKRRTGDDSKTRALLAAGYSVVRVRETGLTALDIDDPGLLQLDFVYRPGTDAQIEASLAPTVTAIMSWLEDQTALAAAA